MGTLIMWFKNTKVTEKSEELESHTQQASHAVLHSISMPLNIRYYDMLATKDYSHHTLALERKAGLTELQSVVAPTASRQDSW